MYNLMAFLVFSGGEGGGSLLDINPGVIFWTTLTFLILLFVLKKTAWKPILDSLNAREKSISDAIESAEKAREEAEKLLAENKANLAKAEEEAQKIIQQGREYSEKLKAQMLEESKAEAKKLVDDASAEIERKNKEMFVQLKNEVATIAVKAAEKLIMENLDEEKQSKIVSKYIEDISKN